MTDLRCAERGEATAGGGGRGGGNQIQPKAALYLDSNTIPELILFLSVSGLHLTPKRFGVF